MSKKSKKNDSFIIRKRICIFRDFTISLINNIDNYYPGDNCMGLSDIKNHYNWCLKKTNEEYLFSNIDFSKNKELKDYFYLYFNESFYKNKNRSINKMLIFWKNIFDYENTLKTKIDIDLLVEIYNLLDKSIKVKKSIVLLK